MAKGYMLSPRMSTLTTLFNIVLEIQGRAIRQEINKWGIHVEKEKVNVLLFVVDMILDSRKQSTKKTHKKTQNY